jgi:hypothetical protein
MDSRLAIRIDVAAARHIIRVELSRMLYSLHAIGIQGQTSVGSHMHQRTDGSIGSQEGGITSILGILRDAVLTRLTKLCSVGWAARRRRQNQDAARPAAPLGSKPEKPVLSAPSALRVPIEFRSLKRKRHLLGAF